MNRVKRGDTIAVWVSCGAASAVAAQQTIKRYGETAKIRFINNPIAEECSDNQRFLGDMEKWLGVKVETAINSKYPSCSAVEVWEKRRFMSGPQGAPCTLELKKRARQQWEDRNHTDWIVLGFTFEEKRRSDRFILTERENLLPILIEEKITKDECYRIINSAGLMLPLMYRSGYPNANCIGCVKASSATYWQHVKSRHPTIFKQRAEQSRDIGAKLVRVRNKRIFLDELKPTDMGAPLKDMDFECGIFCEEYA